MHMSIVVCCLRHMVPLAHLRVIAYKAGSDAHTQVEKYAFTSHLHAAGPLPSG